MLTFSLAVADGNFNRECLEYQNAALSAVRKRITSPDKATMESTLGAILLLAGVEVRLSPSPLFDSSQKSLILQARQGVPRQVQLHMGAIHQLLEVCQRERVYLSDGIKRAIFW